MGEVERLIQRSVEVKLAFLEEGGAKVLEKMAAAVLKALRKRNRVYLCGNGGSAADCQHIAGEFVGDTDILGPMAESGELQSLLEKTFADRGVKPTIQLH